MPQVSCREQNVEISHDIYLVLKLVYKRELGELKSLLGLAATFNFETEMCESSHCISEISWKCIFEMPSWGLWRDAPNK